MIGRFLLGMVSGGVLVTGGLVVGAILFPLRGSEVTASAGIEAPPVEELAEVADAEPVAEPVPQPEPEPEPIVEPEPAPEAVVEALADAPKEGAEEAPAVEAASPEVETEAPEVVSEPIPKPAAEGATEAVVAAKAPEAPATEIAAEPKAEPAAVAEVEPAVEPASEPAVEAEPVATAEPTVTAEVTAPVDAAPAPGATVPEAVAEPEIAAPATEEPASEPQPAPEPEPVPEAAAEVPAADPPLMPGTRSKPLPGAEEPATPDVGPVVEATPGAGPTLEPSPGLDAMPEGVVVGRLPKIGDTPEVAVEAEALGEAPAKAALPIVAFAATFENAGNKPVLAVVLIDDGAADLDRAALAALPFPVSFALDPLDPATPERAALYRAAGREVVMLATGIAYGAQASDVEVAFQSMAQGLPEAVAVMDLATPMFQNQRPLASIVVPVVASQGRGLLTWDKGLNAADQVARREDVAAAVIFRDIASSGTDGEAIRRLLDRAVFKAGQDGRAVVAGTATPETVAALLEWSVEGRAATIALGPLTAAMQVD